MSHFTKLALVHIAQKIIREKGHNSRAERLAALLAAKDWAHIAQEVGVKVIHISERDTQITNKPKKVFLFDVFISSLNPNPT